MDEIRVDVGGDPGRLFYRFSTIHPEIAGVENPPDIPEPEAQALRMFAMVASGASNDAVRCDGPTVFHENGSFECHGLGCGSDIGTAWHHPAPEGITACDQWFPVVLDLYTRCPRCKDRLS